MTDLASTLVPCEPWLVVLAACETAQAADGPAIAHELAGSGVPAVVGMRHLVDLVAVERFSREFYPAAFALVRAAVEARGGAERTLDWAAALTAPRMALGSPDPVQLTTWADPVLYVQVDELRVVVPATQDVPPERYEELRGELDVWERYESSLNLRAVDPDALTEITERVQSLRRELHGA